MTTPSAQDDPVAGQITLRYWASARAVTGVAEEVVGVSGPVPLGSLIEDAVARYGGPGSRAADVLACCSVLLGDRQVATEDPARVLVSPGETLEFLPPFAGG